MLPVRSHARVPMSNRAVTANVLRCCSLISSEFCGSVVCGYAGREEHSSSSRSAPSRKTCVGLQR